MMAEPAEHHRPRTVARVAAVQALYQTEQAMTPAEVVIEEFLRHRLGGREGEAGFAEGRTPGAHAVLFKTIVRAAILGRDRNDTLITESLPADWPLTRLDPVLRALLRAAVAELVMADGPPARVVINEYLDVAHGFFAADEARLVNGVLDRLAHLLHASEFPDSLPS